MDRKLKNIVIVYDYAYFNGGAAKVAIQSAIALSKQTHLNVFYFSAVGPVCEELICSAVHCVCLSIKDINSEKRFKSIKNGVWNAAARNAFIGLLNQLDTEETIIHYHGWVKALSVSVVECAVKKNYECVITLHDYFTICPNGGLYNYQSGRICKIRPSSLKCYFCNCDKRNYLQKIWRDFRQICQNLFIKNNRNISYISISQLNEKVVAPFVSSNSFYRVVNPTTVVRSEHKSQSNTILYVGRLSEEKGAELFCQCISEIKKKGNTSLNGIIIGDGIIYKELYDKYKGVIEFAGWKDEGEVRQYMHKARALILPSKWYEGAPLTIIEALMAGLPCIVSDCTSAVELIKDGVNGFVFAQEDLDSLVKKTEEVFDDRVYMKMVRNIQEQFQPIDYSMETHIARLLEVYESCMLGRQ